MKTNSSDNSLPKTPPFGLSIQLPNQYMRWVMYHPPLFVPGIILNARIDVHNLQKIAKQNKLSINCFIIKSMAKTLRKYPQFNYFCLDGKILWAGDRTRVSIVAEVNPLEETTSLAIADSENKSPEQIQKELSETYELQKQSKQQSLILSYLLESYPRLMFSIALRTGLLTKAIVAEASPVVLSNINVPGIEEMLAGGLPIWQSLVLCPGSIEDNKMVLNIICNHKLGNARAFAAYLLEIKELLEHPEQLLS